MVKQKFYFNQGKPKRARTWMTKEECPFCNGGGGDGSFNINVITKGGVQYHYCQKVNLGC